MANKTAVESVATAVNAVARSYVSHPLSADPNTGQSLISGSVKGMVRVSQSQSAAAFQSQVVIRVVSWDGAVERGVLLPADTQALSDAWATSLSSRRFRTGFVSPGTLLAPVAIVEGDRVVIEIGFRSFNTATQNRTGTLSFGDNSLTDLSEVEGVTVASNPWIEFSQDLSFEPITMSTGLVSNGTAELSVDFQADSGLITQITCVNTSAYEVHLRAGNSVVDLANSTLTSGQSTNIVPVFGNWAISRDHASGEINSDWQFETQWT